MTIKKNTAGFTLVEIMIVVAIIGLLAAIAVPNFVQARTNARRSSCINNMRLIDAAKEQYALENNKDATTTPAAADVTPYLKSNVMPTCPSSGTYTIDAIGTLPSCDKAAAPDLHVLP
jgi:prepilin-type N-terminal cleavage/methylation domain-containing protein